MSLVKESSAQKKTKAAPKPKKPKDTTKKPARKERAKATPSKITKDFKKRMKRSEIMEDPDLDKEIDILAVSGLKNQLHTLQFSRLMGK